MTGKSHYLEIFSETSGAVQPSFGIGFYSATKGCLEVIQKNLSTLKNAFIPGPKENWGQITESKTAQHWIWIYEPSESYVGSQKLDKEIYLRKLRTMNGDKKVDHKFKKISKISIVSSSKSSKVLIEIFDKLGWERSSKGIFTDGKTEVLITSHPNVKKYGIKKIELHLDPKLSTPFEEKFDSVNFNSTINKIFIEIP